MRKNVSLILAISILLCGLPFNIFTAIAENNTITWLLEGNMLTISGSGEMENYATPTFFEGAHFFDGGMYNYETNEWEYSTPTAPWYETIVTSFSEDSEINVIIEDGITSIGSCAFDGSMYQDICDYDCSIFNDFGIPTYGPCMHGPFYQAFYGTITIPQSVNSISENAFVNCENTVFKILSNTYAENFLKTHGLTYEIIGEHICKKYLNNVCVDCGKLYSVEYKISNEMGISKDYSPVSFDGVNLNFDDSAPWYGEICNEYYQPQSKNSFPNVNIVIEKGVTRIGAYAFDSNVYIACSGHPDVMPEPWEPQDLYTCKCYTVSVNYSSFYIPHSVTEIDENAFVNCENAVFFVIADSYAEEFAINHSFEYIIVGDHDCEYTTSVTNPTCTEQGYTTFTCNICGHTYKDNYTPSLGGHKFINGICCSVCGEDDPNIKYFKYSVSNGEVTINRCDSAISGDVIIPSTLKGYPVTAIDVNAFEDCSLMTSVTIPESIKTIGEDAFKGCNGLNGVNIANLSAWCNIVFADFNSNPLCYSNNLFINGLLATDITIPDDVERINEFAFYNCTSLNSVSIGNKLKVIGNAAFSGCEALCRVNIADIASWCTAKFNNYDSNPLYYAKNLYLNGELVTDITIPSSVEIIEKYKFYNCVNLKTVKVSEGVTRIRACAFTNCSALESINIPDSLTRIDSYTFGGCSKLSSVYINDISKWFSLSFENTYSSPIQYSTGKIYVNNIILNNLEIPRDIESVGINQLYGCNSLKNVFIPKNITCINKNAFNHCKNLENVYFEGTAEEWEQIEILAGNDKILNANILYEITGIPSAVESLEITIIPPKTQYIQNLEALDLSGGVLTVYYDNCVTQTINLSTLNVTGFDNSVLGKQTLTATYGGLAAQFIIEIIPRPASMISVLQLPQKLKYTHGEALDLTGGKIVAFYSDGTYQTVNISNDMISGFDNGVGFKTLTVTHTGKKAYFSVMVYRNPDLDGNGTVSATDVAILKKSILTSKKDEQLDLNVDGSFDVLDLVHIKKVVS